MTAELHTPETAEPRPSSHTQTGGPPRGFARRERPDVPQTIGRYMVLGVVGSGGMGVVYAAQDDQLGRKVAIKVLHSEGKRKKNHIRLLREARALAKLAHPNVVAIHEVGETGGRIYIAMEFIEGRTLRAWLSERRPSRPEILAALTQAGRGVEAAHAAGLIHRDLKPDNIFVGDDGRVRVMDFGLARASGGDDSDSGTTVQSIVEPTSVTLTGALLGTPGYMAPEQYRGGAIDLRCDVFGFSVVLFEALYGLRPFRGADLAEIRAATFRGAPGVPDDASVPGWLAAIVRRGLAVERSERWPNMSELLTALGRDPEVTRRRVLGWLGGAALAASLVFGLTLLFVTLQQHWAAEHRESQAAGRLDVLTAAISRAEGAGDREGADALFQSFVGDPANAGTRALARAWLRRGDARRHDPSAALLAYAEAYVAAEADDDVTAALRSMSAVFHEAWRGPALARNLAELRELDEDAARGELAVDAALWRRDLAGAHAEVASDSPWAPLLATLARGRPLGVWASYITPLGHDPGPRAPAYVAIHPDAQGGALLDRDLQVLDRWRADGVNRLPVPGTPWLLTHRGREIQLVDLRAPLEVRWRSEAAEGFHHAALLDPGLGGAPTVVFSRRYPARGLRALRLGEGPVHEEVAHRSTDAADSDIEAMLSADFDGDGAPELAVSAGPWRAFDVRILRPAADGALALLGRRQLGRVSALAAVSRDGRTLLAALKDDHCPAPDVFPEPPHLGPKAGLYLLEWTGFELRDAGFVPLPTRDDRSRFVALHHNAAGDFDGDGREDLAFGLEDGGDTWTWLLRQTDAGFEGTFVAGMIPFLAAQIDADPARELLVGLAGEDDSWVLGVEGAPIPPIVGPAATPPPAPQLAAPALQGKERRAEHLAALGLFRTAAATLQGAASLASDASAQLRLWDRSAELWRADGDDESALAIDSRVDQDPDLGPRALGRSAAALTRLGRYEDAYRAATNLLYHPKRSAEDAAAAQEHLARLGPLVAPDQRLDVRFDAPLSRAWQIFSPGALRRAPATSTLQVVSAGAGVPLAELPLEWDAGPLALEIELDVKRLEYGTCLGASVVDADDNPWIGVAVCGLGGGGRTLRSSACRGGRAGWLPGPERQVPSALAPERLRLRVFYDPAQGLSECSLSEGGPAITITSRDTAAPVPGRYRLRLGAGSAGPIRGLAQIDLHRLELRGARPAPVPESAIQRDRPLHLLVESEPLAALELLDALPDAHPRAAFAKVIAHDELADPVGLLRALAVLPKEFDDLTWQLELVLLLRQRPAAAAALRATLGPETLPLLQLAWQIGRAEQRDPAIGAEVLRALRGVDLLVPRDAAGRDALRALLTLRAAIWRHGGETERARRDLEVALTLVEGDAGAGLHLELASLLAEVDPSAARTHATEALRLSATPELVRDRLREFPALHP